jgi:membrane-associated protein
VSTILALGPSWLDPDTIVTTLGEYALWGVMGIIFAECGLLIGFFMPGDSLLFIVGMFVSRGAIHHSLWFVAVCLVIAAVAGNLVGYWIGRKAGPAIFNRPDSRLFKRSYVDKTHDFFERHGGRAIVLARFVPIVRTFITVTAGAARMPFRSYAVYSSIGAVLWAAGVTVLGYFLGRIAFIRDNVEVILLLVVLISVVPMIIEFLRVRRHNRAAAVDSHAADSPAVD